MLSARDWLFHEMKFMLISPPYLHEVETTLYPLPLSEFQLRVDLPTGRSGVSVQTHAEMALS